MNGTLKKWVAESESWQAFIDLKIPIEEQARYKFLPRADDFYISLMNSCYNVLINDEFDKSDALVTAKGLEIYSLYKKSDCFFGINKEENMLVAAGLYYLAEYNSSAIILSRIYVDYDTEIKSFLSLLLNAKLQSNSPLMNKIKVFFSSGNQEELKSLLRNISNRLANAINNNPDEFIACLLAKRLVEKIINDNIWVDLLSINNDIAYWKTYIDHCINKHTPILNFFPSQREAIKNGLFSDSTISLQMPTSSGKSFLAEIIIYHSLKRDSSSKILYLTPFRSLAAELKKSLLKELKLLGITAKTIYGGNLPDINERQGIDEADVLIATPEKFMAMENVMHNLSSLYSIIICDEGHLLDDGNRGLQYELLLSKIKSTPEKKRFIFISAIVPNMESINRWLGGTDVSIIRSNYRPTQLDYAFLKKNDNSYFLDFNPGTTSNHQLYKFLAPDDLLLKKNNKSYRIKSKAAITVACAYKALNQGSVLVFAPQVGGYTGIEFLVKEAIKQIQYSDYSSLIREEYGEDIENLIAYFSVVFGVDYLLCQAVAHGIIYHHGDFPQFVREIVEDAINQGTISLIFCTTTLTEGVNLPIKTIVIHSTKRYNPNFPDKHEFLSTREFKNLTGRAGRAGKELKGLIIIPHEDSFGKIYDVMNDKHIEDIRGRLYNLIGPLTSILIKNHLPLDDKLLEEFSINFPDVINTLDYSLLELLSEEITTDELLSSIEEIVKNTYSYFQSTEEEKATLSKICVFRAQKYIPYIDSNKFRELKESTLPLSSYDEIDDVVDFDNEIWNLVDIAEEDWMTFILDNSLFLLPAFDQLLEQFNVKNDCKIDKIIFKSIVNLWLSGKWFNEISLCTGFEIKIILRLIDKILSYDFQKMVSAIISVAVSRNDNNISEYILNWPKMVQYGLNSQQKLDLYDLGLSDRVALLAFDKYLQEFNYEYISKRELISYVRNNINEMRNIQAESLPSISFNNIIKFIDNIN